MMSWLIVFALAAVLYVLHQRIQEGRVREENLQSRVDSLQHEKSVVLEFLHDLGGAFSDNLNQTDLIKVVMECLQKVTESRGVAIYLWQSDLQKLRAVGVRGLFPPLSQLDSATADKVMSRQEYLETFLKNERVDSHDPHMIARVFREQKPVRVENAREDSRFPKYREESLCVKTYLAVPLTYGGERLGVIAVANHRGERPFTQTHLEIVQSVAEQAAFAIHSVQIYRQLSEKKKIDRDIEMAREIQQILLPSAPPRIEGFEMAAVNLPAQEVSGDYYDFIPVDQYHWGVVIADVSGKGIPASIIMATCRSVLRSKSAESLSPARVLAEVNRQICPDIRRDMFITMIYAVLDIRTGELKVARAGHEAPLLYSGQSEQVETLRMPGVAIGIDPGAMFEEVIEEKVIFLAEGDLFLVYTDGLSESVNARGEEFGLENVRGILRSEGNSTLGELVSHLVERVQQHGGSNRAQMDDITLAVIQRKRKG